MKSIQLFSYINNSNPEEMIQEKETPIKELSVSHPESIMTMFRKRAECYTTTTDVAISVPIQSINRILILAKVIDRFIFSKLIQEQHQ